MKNTDTFTKIYRVVVIAILFFILYEVRNTQDKLKYNLEFLQSSQSTVEADIKDVQQKLKYDLEFIKSNQSTMQEDHNALVKFMTDRNK